MPLVDLRYNLVIETQRLVLREFTKSDAGLILDLNSDPEVIRYTCDPMRDIQHAQQILEQVILPQYTLYRHGRWAVFLKEGHDFIGWCGLKYRPEKEEVDLGYRFRRAFWGRGYATEAAMASVQYGFEKLGLRQIVGRADPHNTNSIRVLEKCGMQPVGEDIAEGHPALTYIISNPFIS